MKRILVLVCAAALALCPCFAAAAGNSGAGFVIPEGLKTVSAAACAVPAEIPEPVRINSFAVTDGLVTLELDREVPSVVITEIDFAAGVESTIFSKSNTASAETHQSGHNSVFTVKLTWNLDGAVFTQEYNTWSGSMKFYSASLAAAEDAEAFPSYTAGREFAFDEEHRLLTENWTLTGSDQTFARVVTFDADAVPADCQVSWRDAEYGGNVLAVDITPEGAVLGLESGKGSDTFTVTSLPLSADSKDLENMRGNCYDPGAFETQLRIKYPKTAERLFGLSTMTDLPTVEGEEHAATENSRIWAVVCGDYFSARVYVFISDDPLFLLQDGKVTANTEARDILGNPVDFSVLPAMNTPAFEAPVFE